MLSPNQFDDDRSLPLRRLNYLLQAGGGLVAFAILATGWLIASAMESQAEDLDMATAQAVALRTRVAQVRDQHSELTAKVKAAEQDVEQARERLGVGPQESRFIAQLTDLADQHGLEVSDVRPGGATSHGAYGVVELQLSAEGGYEGLCSFLADLNQLPRLCHVAAMNVSVLNAQTGKLKIEMKLQLLFSGSQPGQAGTQETRA